MLSQDARGLFGKGRREPPSAMKMTIQEVGMFEQINLVPVIPGASSVIPVMAIFTVIN